MKLLFLAFILLSGCGAISPLVEPLPSDTPTKAILIDAEGAQCSAVVVSENVALTAAHCIKGQGIVLILPEGPVPVADVAVHDNLDLALLLTQIPLPPPYATLGPAPAPGQLAFVEGYGCDRPLPVMPRFSRREVRFLVFDPSLQNFIFVGRACPGDSGGGVFNEAGELVGISSAIGDLNGQAVIAVVPVQSLISAGQ